MFSKSCKPHMTFYERYEAFATIKPNNILKFDNLITLG